MDMVKKKRIFGFATAITLLAWLLIELWFVWDRCAPIWEKIQWMIDEKIMSRTFALESMAKFIGIPNLIFYAVITLTVIATVCAAIWGSKKDRFSIAVTIALFGVLVVDSVRAFLVMRDAFSLVGETEVAKSYLLYIISGCGSPIVFFLVFVTALVAKMGHSFWKRAWFVPGALYFLWVLAYYFLLPGYYSYISEHITLDMVWSVQSGMQVFFAGVLVIMGYWIALFMPSKAAAAKVDAEAIRDAWMEEEAVAVVTQNSRQSKNGQNSKNRKNRQNSIEEKAETKTDDGQNSLKNDQEQDNV